MSRRRFKLAAAQFPIDRLGGWQDFAAKLAGWVEKAAREGAEFLVFPEYGAMELASPAPACRCRRPRAASTTAPGSTAPTGAGASRTRS